MSLSWIQNHRSLPTEPKCRWAKFKKLYWIHELEYEAVLKELKQEEVVEQIKD